MRRTYGMETEYAVRPDVTAYAPRHLGEIRGSDLRNLTTDSQEALVYGGFSNARQNKFTPAGLTVAQTFISNGMHNYIDIGHHPELSDAESFSALGMTLCHFAGVEFMRQKAQLVSPYAADIHNARMKALDAKPSFFIPKDKQLTYHLQRQVTDGDRGSWGVHLNLSAARELIPTDESLSPLLLAMLGGIPLFGAGYVNGAGEYRNFQKGSSIRCYTGDDTVFTKPLINLRDEPHADANKYRRLHIVGNDPLSVYPTWLRAGMYELCLSLCESRPELAYKLAELLPENVMKAIGILNTTDNPFASFELGDGTLSHAPNLLELLHEEAATFVADEDPGHELHNEHQLVLQEWRAMIDALYAEDPVLHELFDGYRRRDLYEQARDKGKAPKVLQRLYHLSNDISDHCPPGLKRQFQDYLANNGWERLGQLYGYDPEKLKAVAGDYVSSPTGRAAERSRDIRHGSLTKVDWEVWFNEERDIFRTHVPPDFGLNGHYDPLARVTV